MCVAWAFVANFLGCHVLVAVLTIMAERTVFLFLRHTPNDIAVVSFSLAVNSGYGDKQKASFVDCVAWRSTAEFICKYFAKGQEMNLVGSLQTRTYEDRNGNTRKATEVVAREVDFCGPKASQEASPKPKKRAKGNSKNAATAPALPNYDADDDLPF